MKRFCSTWSRIGLSGKESLADKDKVCQAICAFANDMPGSRRPGVVFIGARDDGTPSNLLITDRLLRDL